MYLWTSTFNNFRINNPFTNKKKLNIDELTKKKE